MPVVNTLSASLDGSATQLVPTGSILTYAGSSAPAGWLVCDGQAVSRTTYANLFSALGTTFGTGDGSTTFNLPDLRGRFIRYDDNMGSHGISGVSSTGAASRDTSRAHGSAQGQATAKNGLAVTNNTVTSVGMNANATHSHGVGAGNNFMYGSGTVTGAGTAHPGGNAVTYASTTGSANIDHTHSVTSNVTLGNGDAETRPINIALNAIIKI